MKICLTGRQRELWELAGTLGDRFAERAERHDRENTFPLENYDDMRAAGYLNLTVPTELGGGGATLSDLVIAQERLAQGDGATALAVNMHLSPIGQWAAVWRRTKDPRLEQLLGEVAAGNVVWASLTSEVGVRNMMMDSNTMAEKVDGGYRVSGRKIFCTNSDVATHFTFSARIEHPELGPRLALFRTQRDADGLTFVRTWDTLGMRATQSNDLEIADLFVPDDALVHSLPVNHYDATVLETVFAWAMPTFGAVYVGVAGGAMEWSRAMTIKRGRADDPLVQATFADMEVLLESARSVLWRHVADVTSGELFRQLTVQEGLARCALVKLVAANNAVDIMRLLVDVVGGPAYSRKLPFERMWRDAMAGPIMPYTNVQARRLMGATAFGIELHPTISLEESGLDSRPKEATPVAAAGAGA